MINLEDYYTKETIEKYNMRVVDGDIVGHYCPYIPVIVGSTINKNTGRLYDKIDMEKLLK